MTVKSDIEIAREAKMKPIMAIGKGLGIPESDLIPYGHTKAKVNLSYIDSLKSKPNGHASSPVAEDRWRCRG